MKAKCWLLLLASYLLFMLISHSGIVQNIVRRRESLFAQIVDGLGIQSTVYMPNVSCSGCNQYNSRYIIDARAGIDCSFDHELFLLILTVSDAKNFNRRKYIRQTWGSVGEHQGHTVRTYFICGRSDNSTVEAELAKEAAYWGDIVQIDIPDNYAGLTNKTIVALKWAIGRCGSHFRYILKTDDDSFNIPQHFIDYLDSVGDQRDVFVGGLCASGEEPNRINWHKWFVPVSAYPGSVYPLHCKGRAYVLSSAAALLISSVSRDVAFNAMEDVYVTGVCRTVASIPCHCMPGIPRHPEALTDCDIASGQIMNTHYVLSSERMKRLWTLANNKTAQEICSVPVSNVWHFVVTAMFVMAVLLLCILCYSNAIKWARDHMYHLKSSYA